MNRPRSCHATFSGTSEPRITPQRGRRGLLRAAAALALCTGGLAQSGTPGEVTVGQPLPPAVLTGLNGPPRNLSEFLGRPLIINVWASWCGPCREEMASLERLAWREPLGRFNIIGISTDDDARAAQTWLRRSNATISHFIDHRLVMENMLGAAQLPLTVLVDARGRVLLKVYGGRQWDAPQSLALIEQTFARARGAAAP